MERVRDPHGDGRITPLAWHAVYRKRDGELVSTGEAVARPLPKGLASKRIARQGGPDEVWDPKRLRFVRAPFVDRAPELLREIETRGVLRDDLREGERRELTRLLGDYLERGRERRETEPA